VGAGLSPLFALGLIGSVAGGWMADRVGPGRPEAYGVIPGVTLLLTVPFFLGGLMAQDGKTTLLFFAIPLLLSYAWIGPGLAATQTMTPPASRAAVAAIIGFFNNLIGIGLGPLAVGALSDALRPHYGEGEALRLALMAGSSAFALAAVLFVAAGYALKRDLKRRT
jgi:MFS family permease